MHFSQHKSQTFLLFIARSHRPRAAGGDTLDYELTSSLTIKVRSTNNYSLSFDKELTISVLDDINDNLSVTDNIEMQNFKVYPNPVTSVLNISHGKNHSIEILEIFTITGVSVMRVPYTEKLDISGLPAAIYQLCIISDGKTYYHKILVE